MLAPARDLAIVLIAYVVCVAGGAISLIFLDFGTLWNAFAADVIATVIIFGFSLGFKNSSMYDAYWSVIPPLLGLYWMCVEPAAASSPRAWLITALVWFWAIRLTTNWTVHWAGMSHEDWRYPIVRERAGRAGTLVDFLGIHLFPTVQVFLGCLPMLAVMRHPDVPLGWLDALAVIVTFGAVVIEMVADLQLHAFIKTRKPGEFIKTGLWAWSRHPNYFGELAFWWGLMLFGLAAAPEHWTWIIPGAIAMTLMFVFVSIPFMDERSAERRPAYAEHMKRVSALVPLPPRG